MSHLEAVLALNNDLSDATATTTSPGFGPSINCDDPDYWAPTVSNWLEEGVDVKLSSWALDLVPNPPTAIPQGSYPTELPRIFTGFGNTTKYKKLIGIPGQLMAQQKKGVSVSSCELIYGVNGQCLSIDGSTACASF